MEQQSQPPAQWPQPPTPPAQPAPRPRMSAGAKWAIGCGVAAALAIIALLILMIAGMMGVIATAAEFGAPTGGNLAVVRVEGVITAGAGVGLFGEGAASERIVEQLRQAARRSAVKAVLLRIDSPGGSAAGAQEIYQQILHLRKRGKPVYVSMGDVAASGGYYVASAADRIYANPGTITGSIGVISTTLDLSGLFDKIGIDPEVIKTGEFKDMGSGLRPMTEREREVVRELLDDVYHQFVTAVADGRRLPEARVLELADGRVFTGKRAQELKLVDELGGYRTALLAVAKKGGIKGEPQIVEFREPGLLRILLGDLKAPAPPQMRGLLYDRVADLLARGALTIEK